ncbi:hypothetical protein ACNKHS_16975 [Shigella flexneri]
MLALEAGIQRGTDILAIEDLIGRIPAASLREGPLTLEAMTSFSQLPHFANQLPTYISVNPVFPA